MAVRTFLFAILLFLPLLANDPAMKENIFKIVTPEQWEESQDKEALVLAPMDKNFVHFSTEEQVAKTVEKFFKGVDYVLLTIDPTQLQGKLVFETNPGGTTKYYHLYEGSVPRHAILDVKKVISGP